MKLKKKLMFVLPMLLVLCMVPLMLVGCGGGVNIPSRPANIGSAVGGADATTADIAEVLEKEFEGGITFDEESWAAMRMQLSMSMTGEMQGMDLSSNGTATIYIDDYATFVDASVNARVSGAVEGMRVNESGSARVRALADNDTEQMYMYVTANLPRDVRDMMAEDGVEFPIRGRMPLDFGDLDIFPAATQSEEDVVQNLTIWGMILNAIFNSGDADMGEVFEMMEDFETMLEFMADEFEYFGVYLRTEGNNRYLTFAMEDEDGSVDIMLQTIINADNEITGIRVWATIEMEGFEVEMYVNIQAFNGSVMSRVPGAFNNRSTWEVFDMDDMPDIGANPGRCPFCAWSDEAFQITDPADLFEWLEQNPPPSVPSCEFWQMMQE